MIDITKMGATVNMMMQHIPQAHEIYRHFKGNMYQVITVAKHTETGEMLVVYQAMYGDYGMYARPIELFTGKVDKLKYPDAEQEYRFERQSANENTASRIPEVQAAFSEETVQKDMEEEARPVLDPLVEEFLDADSYQAKLNILTGVHHRITDDMLNVMAIASDIELRQGDVEQRYEDLKSCLQKLDIYECNRVR